MAHTHTLIQRQGPDEATTLSRGSHGVIRKIMFPNETGTRRRHDTGSGQSTPGGQEEDIGLTRVARGGQDRVASRRTPAKQARGQQENTRKTKGLHRICRTQSGQRTGFASAAARTTRGQEKDAARDCGPCLFLRENPNSIYINALFHFKLHDRRPGLMPDHSETPAGKLRTK